MSQTKRAALLAFAAIMALCGVLPTRAAQAAVGDFEVVGTQIVAPDGKQFVPVGTNVNGPNSFFDVPTAGLSKVLGQAWRFNTVRLVTCLPGGCQGGNSAVNNDLDAIVAEFTAAGMVVIIDYHQLGFGDAATSADVAAATQFWAGIARRFRTNPYVWFNLFNEPDATYNDASRGGTAASRWRAQHQPVIDAVRAEGATNIIVIDDTQAGQGAADWWQIGPSPAGDSGVLSEGAQLRDPVKRLVFSVHAYDVWGFPNGNDPTCASRYSDDQRDARFRSYIERAQAAGHALIVGELGFRPVDQLATGLSDHGERYGQQPPCGSTQRLAAETVYRVAPTLGVGVLTWHGYALVDQGPQAFNVSGAPPANLTRLGELQFAYAQQVGGTRPAPGNASPTSAPPGGAPPATVALPSPASAAPAGAAPSPAGAGDDAALRSPGSAGDHSGPVLVGAIVLVLVAIGATSAALRRRALSRAPHGPR